MRRYAFFSVNKKRHWALFVFGVEILLLSYLSAADDEDIAVLFRSAGLLAFACGLAPLTLGAAETATGAAFTTTVGVIDRVHGGATHVRANTLPAVTSGLSFVTQFVLVVRHFADRGPGHFGHLADLRRRHLEIRVAEVVRNEFHEVTRRTCDLGACTRLDLDVEDECTDRDLLQRKAVARLDRCLLACHDRIADLEGLRGDHVAALSVRIADECDETGTMRIVFDRLDTRRNILLVEFEVDITHELLVPASHVTHRDATKGVAACGRTTAGDERLCGSGFALREKLAEGGQHCVTIGRGCWFEFFHDDFEFMNVHFLDILRESNDGQLLQGLTLNTNS